MKVFDQMGIEVEMVVLLSLIAMLGMLILIIILFVKNSKLNKKYRRFMSGSDATSLEQIVLKRFKDIDQLKALAEKNSERLDQVNEEFLKAYQKTGIVKYNAFKEMGGKLSFAVALLNKEDSGFIINSMHTTSEGCYTYIKEVIHGESYVVLAAEEQEALNQAIKSQDLIQ